MLSDKSVHTPTFLSDDILKYLIPTTVTLLVFALGVLPNWLRLNNERRRHTRQAKDLFYTWIPNLVSPLEEYAVSCVDLSNRLKISERLSPESFGFIDLHIGKLVGLDLGQLVQAFIYNSTGVAQRNNEQLFVLVSHLEHLDKLGPEIEAKYKEHYQTTSQLLIEWNNAMINLSKVQGEMIIAPGDKSKARIALEDQLKLNVQAWGLSSAEKSQNTVNTYNTLIAANTFALAQYFKEAKTADTVVMDLVIAHNTIAFIYQQWLLSREKYANVFVGYADKLRNSYNSLQQAITYFRIETNTKKICS